jgi:hypothetical protein
MIAKASFWLVRPNLSHSDRAQGAGGRVVCTEYVLTVDLDVWLTAAGGGRGSGMQEDVLMVQ